MMGDRWHKLNEDEQDQLILLLQDDSKSDEEVVELLNSKYGLSGEVAENVLDVRLPDGHGSLSKAAIDKILPIMRDQGLIYYDAVKEAGFGEANLYDPNAPLQNKLEYYGKALSGHVLNASGKPEDPDEVRYGIITNPTVHIALNQVRQVVNELFASTASLMRLCLRLRATYPWELTVKEIFSGCRKPISTQMSAPGPNSVNSALSTLEKPKQVSALGTAVERSCKRDAAPLPASRSSLRFVHRQD